MESVSPLPSAGWEGQQPRDSYGFEVSFAYGTHELEAGNYPFNAPGRICVWLVTSAFSR